MPSSIDLPPIQSQFKMFIENQFKTKPRSPPSSLTFSGQTAVITGSNIGIGLECARLMLDHQLSHLIMAVRSLSKGEKAAEALRKTHTNADIEVWELDMLSYPSVQAFAKRCEFLPKGLDIAILNAGVAHMNFTTNASTGHEEIIQVNYLSTALLSILLLPTLAKARRESLPEHGPSRLLIVSSALGLFSKFPNHAAVPLLPTFDNDKAWDLQAASERYAVSKTLVNMFMYCLSRLVSCKDVIVDSVEPGYTKGTGLSREVSNAPWIMRVVVWLMQTLTARTPEQAAYTYIDAVTAKGEESHGSFVMCYRNWP